MKVELGTKKDTSKKTSLTLNITEHRHFGIRLIAAIVALSNLMSMSVGLVGMILLAAAYLLSTITAFEDRHDYPSVGHPERRLWLHRARLAWVVRVGADWSWEIRIGRHVTAFGTRPGEDSSREPALKISDYDLRSGWKMPVLQAEIFSFERKRESGGISRIHRAASRAFLASVTTSWLHLAASGFTTCSRPLWSFSRSCWSASVFRASSAPLLAQLFLEAQVVSARRGAARDSVSRM
ncbi:hypothetical protein ABIC08_008232 [Bradyrhizobium sp. RT9b]|uniref:hypothetical protein n=1 Tax=Bradyrhizobium sp. RT9b TaxID=3156385 RepID=UPI003390A3B4